MGEKTFDVNAAEWDSEVLGSDTPVLVDFWAEWCGPCKMIAPMVDEIAVEYEGQVRVAKVDADANPEVLQKYGIMGIPTLILFKSGEEAARVTGFKPKGKILEKLTPHFN
ncbi:MAG: thioredoxin [Anaerolineae bacterium]|nr:thioredoxin [Anaerolineae bacterium]